MRTLELSLLLAAPLLGQDSLPAPAPNAAPTPTFAGTYHLATGALVPGGGSGPAGGLGTPIYDNTCTFSGWYDMCDELAFVDWGRLPSPTSTDGIVGDQTSYRVDGLELGYVTSELDPAFGGPGTTIELRFWEDFVPCAQPWSSAPPTKTLVLTGLPGASPGGTSFHTVAVDLRGTPDVFCLRADGDGAYGGAGYGDHFGWAFRLVNPTGLGGVLIAGDASACAPGDGTRWQNPDLPGTGLGNDDRFVATYDQQDPCAGWVPFCFASQSFAGMHLRLYTDSPTVCTDPGAPYCFGTNCYCGNMDPTAGCRNSTGQGGLLLGDGSDSLGLDDLTLVATQLPPTDSFALLIWGPEQSDSQIGSGNLCVSPSIRRLLPASPVGADGRVVFGPGIVAANDAVYSAFAVGDTWNFQAWYRDVPQCAPTGPFNLTNAYSVVFTP